MTVIKSSENNMFASLDPFVVNTLFLYDVISAKAKAGTRTHAHPHHS